MRWSGPGTDAGLGSSGWCGPVGRRGRRRRRQGSSCRSRSRRRHTAHKRPFERTVTVHYPFHPQVGQRVLALGRREHHGETHLVVRQPDETLAFLPAWMTEAAAARVEIVSVPRIELRALFELRRLLEGSLSSAQALAESTGGEGDATTHEASGRSVSGRRTSAEQVAVEPASSSSATSRRADVEHGRTPRRRGGSGGSER